MSLYPEGRMKLVMHRKAVWMTTKIGKALHEKGGMVNLGGLSIDSIS